MTIESETLRAARTISGSFKPKDVAALLPHYNQGSVVTAVSVLSRNGKIRRERIGKLNKWEYRNV